MVVSPAESKLHIRSSTRSAKSAILPHRSANQVQLDSKNILFYFHPRAAGAPPPLYTWLLISHAYTLAPPDYTPLVVPDDVVAVGFVYSRIHFTYQPSSSGSATYGSRDRAPLSSSAAAIRGDQVTIVSLQGWLFSSSISFSSLVASVSWDLQNQLNRQFLLESCRKSINDTSSRGPPSELIRDNQVSHAVSRLRSFDRKIDQ